MRNTIVSIVIIAFVVGTAFALTQCASQSSRTKPAAEKETPNESEKILVANFNIRAVPIGYLGHPLGTIVRVTGTAISGDATRMKKYSGKTLKKELKSLNLELFSITTSTNTANSMAPSFRRKNWILISQSLPTMDFTIVAAL